MSALLAVQQTIYNVLIADTALRTLLATHAYAGSPTLPSVYDHVPQFAASEDDDAFPYVAIGEYTAAEFDTDDIDGMEQTIALHCWDRRRGKKRVKQVADAVYNALHNVTLEVVGQHAIFCYFEFSESIPDPDVMTHHLVMRLRVVTQEH